MKKSQIFAVLIIIAIYLGLSLLAFWGFYPYKYVDIQTIEIPSPQTLGQPLHYTVSYCKHQDTVDLVTRQLISKDGTIFLPDITTNNPMGCVVKAGRTLEYPSYTPKGTYVYRVSLRYRVNPIRDIIITKESNQFELK